MDLVLQHRLHGGAALQRGATPQVPAGDIARLMAGDHGLIEGAPQRAEHLRLVGVQLDLEEGRLAGQVLPCGQVDDVDLRLALHHRVGGVEDPLARVGEGGGADAGGRGHHVQALARLAVPDAQGLVGAAGDDAGGVPWRK